MRPCPACDRAMAAYWCQACQHHWTWEELTRPELRLVWLSGRDAVFSATVPASVLRDDGTAQWRGEAWRWRPWG